MMESVSEIKTDPIDDDDYRQSTTVVLSRTTSSRDDSCGSDSGSQSLDEDSAGSSSTINVELGNTRVHTARSRHHGDPERRARRAIANSNERRRMQSINAGFESLRDLVKPRHGEKLSKAAILQRAVDYIDDLHRQKEQLVAKNARLMQLLATRTGSSRPEVTSSLPGAAKRRRLESLSSCSLSSDDGAATDTPTCGPRRRKPEVDRQEADWKLDDGAEDLRIASLPLTTATLPVAAQVTVAPPSVDTASCSENRCIRSLLASSTADQLDLASTLDRSALTTWTSATTSDSLWPSTSRRNLETILEAIRHLEGEAAGRRDEAGQVTSNSLSLAEALMSSPSVQFVSSNSCVTVRSS